MATLEETQAAAKQTYELEQTEVGSGAATGSKKPVAVLGKTMIGSRKKYEIDQTENIVPGSTHPSDVRTVKNQ